MIKAYGLCAPAVLSLALAITPAWAQAPIKLDPRTAVYELRTYYVAPGKLEALNARFRQHTLKLFDRHGMTNVAYWSDMDAPNGRVIYILAFPSRAAREADWKAFSQDPEWRKVAAASEANGKLVEKVNSVFMSMTDDSPALKLKH